ncbi:MAG TPA: hypothetical protein VGO62_17695 [Myxococcota bacterium]|jgi:hypothetical protein
MSRLAADLVCRSLLCFGIAGAVAGFMHAPLAASAPPVVPEQPSAVFGAFDECGDLVQTDLIPLVPGQEFGWRMPVADTFPHSWREVLITPNAPREWIGADLAITDDGKVGVTERTEAPIDGVLEHSWTVTDGDPAGQHEMQLYVDGTLVKTFHFVVR